MVLSMDNQGSMHNQSKGQLFQKYPCSQPLLFPRDLKEEDQNNWVIMEGEIYDANNNSTAATSTTSSSSIGEESTNSNGSSSSLLDTTDDASSSSTHYSSSANSTGSLYDLSDLMSKLPIKRGLSKFYQGKSQSFTSLSSVRSIEDLPKKESQYNNKRKLMKASKSYGGGLDKHKSYTLLPKSVISNKTSNRSKTFSSFPHRKGSSMNNCRPPVYSTTKEPVT